MKDSQQLIGWHIHHKEKLLYKFNAKPPTIRLKFFHYPTYRQTVQIDRSPQHCKLKVKGDNSFFIYKDKARAKGAISLERIITVIPTPSFANPKDDWGKISNFSRVLQQKYQQSSSYWPLKSIFLHDVSRQEWFKTDDISRWVQLTYRYIAAKIKYREKQEKRLGADQAFLTDTGDCDEFTDLFVTFARIRGIPCRRLTGYFITKNGASVEAHAWAEILSPKKKWIIIDIALNNIGNHSINYVILKIEEFNPSLPDYHIETGRSSTVHYQWERPIPTFTPIYH